MSTKGEKWGFSGAIEHWMACKVLKRKRFLCELYGSPCDLSTHKIFNRKERKEIPQRPQRRSILFYLSVFLENILPRDHALQAPEICAVHYWHQRGLIDMAQCSFEGQVRMEIG